jgi:preprotein translocase subunit YajC
MPIILTILQQQGGMGMALIFQLVMIVAIFYFLLILPQKRERKRHREMLEALKPGDEIVTTGGLVGDVISLKEQRVMLKSGDARVVVEKGRIAALTNPPEKSAK